LDHGGTLSDFPDSQHIEDVVKLTSVNELLHGDPSSQTSRAMPSLELIDEVVNDGLTALRPLDQKFVVVTLVAAWEVARIHRKKHQGNVDKDGDDAFQLVAAEHSFTELVVLTSELVRTILGLFVLFYADGARVQKLVLREELTDCLSLDLGVALS